MSDHDGFGERQGDDTGDDIEPGPDAIAVEFYVVDDPTDDPNEDVYEVEE